MTESKSAVADLMEWADNLLPDLPEAIEEMDEDYDDDDSADELDYDLKELKIASQITQTSSLQPSVQENKFSGRINLEPLHDTVRATGAAVGSLKEQQRKSSSMVRR